MNSNVKQIISLLLVLTIRGICASDITAQAFGAINDTIISAFGDFNSDELTDVFVRSTDGRVLEILLASDQEPLLRRSSSTKCIFKDLIITSIVPGDFDGDAYMDLLITSKPKPKSNATDPNLLDVYINWGGSDVLNCTDESAGPLFQMIGEPMALDYNSDMIIDLFGLNESGNRVFWLFNKTRQHFEEIPMVMPIGVDLRKLLIPHSHAYLDLNNDFRADLFLTTANGFEIWHGTGNEGFEYAEHRQPPIIVSNFIVGQSIFLDVELNGNIAQVIPMCFDSSCRRSSIFAYVNGKYYDLDIDFKDDKNQEWQFIKPDPSQKSIYQDTITLRGGDFNLDGYPDMLVTLKNMANGNIQTFLMENIKCVRCDSNSLTRSFAIKWTAFAPYSNGTVVGAFYDFYQVSDFFRLIFFCFVIFFNFSYYSSYFSVFFQQFFDIAKPFKFIFQNSCNFHIFFEFMNIFCLFLINCFRLFFKIYIIFLITFLYSTSFSSFSFFHRNISSFHQNFLLYFRMVFWM